MSASSIQLGYTSGGHDKGSWLNQRLVPGPLILAIRLSSLRINLRRVFIRYGYDVTITKDETRELIDVDVTIETRYLTDTAVIKDDLDALTGLPGNAVQAGGIRYATTDLVSSTLDNGLNVVGALIIIKIVRQGENH